MAYYGTVAEADAYFAARLHSDVWTDAVASDKPKALTEATQLIDALNYRGVKNALWLIMYEWNAQTERYEKILVDVPTRDEKNTANATQVLEFPRGQDTTVPEEIEWACYETALALLEGFDPEDAVERTNVIRQGYAAVRTTYAEGSASQEYLVYGIPTARVWRWLKPRLTDGRIIRISRAD
jgi:hypothetical protein